MEDFDNKLNSFRKKALWKQLEGYKHLLGQKEAELRSLNEAKSAATRTTAAVLQALSLLISSIDSKADTINENLLPVLQLAPPEHQQPFESFLRALSAVMEGKKVSMRPVGAVEVSEAKLKQKIEELTEALEDATDKAQSRENALFSAQKMISDLRRESMQSIPSKKRSRTDNSLESSSSTAADSSCASDADQTALKVMQVEAAESQRVAALRLAELEVVFVENQKLKQELEHQQEQIKRIPSEFLKDLPGLKYLHEEIRRFKHDLNRADDTIKALEREASDSSYRHGKIVAELERDVREKYGRLDEFVRCSDQETARLRKDRDTMRQMYEQSNSLLSAAQKQLSVYEGRLASNESALKTLNETISTLKSQLSQISLLPNGTGAQVQSALDALRADEQAYIDELENLGRAFEQLQGENTLLMKRVTEKEEQISKLLGEKLKAEFANSQLQKETESGLVRAQKIEEIAKHRVSESEGREVKLRQQLGEVERHLADRIAAVDSYKGRLSDAGAEISLLRTKIDRLNGEVAEAKAKAHDGASNASATAANQVSYEKRRLAEELAIARKKLEVYAASGVGIVKDLEEELVIYKKLMKCNSCHTRDKNAVILKCMHCFCKQCLDIRLETRQRKCPNCGDAFGASDVKQIYL